MADVINVSKEESGSVNNGGRLGYKTEYSQDEESYRRCNLESYGPRDLEILRVI